MNKGICMLGAGGHGKVVLSSMSAAGMKVETILDDDPHILGSEIGGIRVDGPIDDAHTEMILAAVAAVGDNEARKRLVERLHGVNWIRVVHPWSYVHPSVRIGEGTVIFAGAVIQPDVSIGRHCIINTGSTIDHDSVLGDYVHLAPGVNLAGNVCLQDGVFLGIGSVVIIGRSVGRWTTVGAGGVVRTDLPPHAVAMGVPARVKKYKGISL